MVRMAGEHCCHPCGHAQARVAEDKAAALQASHGRAVAALLGEHAALLSAFAEYNAHLETVMADSWLHADVLGSSGGGKANAPIRA
jgi:hypothetical protein